MGRMKEITISETMLQNAIEKAMPKIIEEKLACSYSSPLGKIVEEELNKQDGLFREIVTGTISKAVNEEKFKERLGEKVLEKMISKVLLLR
jgi:hypothetical protein